MYEHVAIIYLCIISNGMPNCFLKPDDLIYTMKYHYSDASVRI